MPQKIIFKKNITSEDCSLKLASWVTGTFIEILINVHCLYKDCDISTSGRGFKLESDFKESLLSEIPLSVQAKIQGNKITDIKIS